MDVIGASVLDYIEGAESSALHSRPTSANGKPEKPVESLLGSFLRRDDEPKRTLVVGPKQSGKTTLAMNLAYGLASTARCRAKCYLEGSVCQCVAVSFFTTAGNEADFPLYCKKTISPEQMNLKARLRELDRQHETWDERILRRIRVYHVSSTRQLLKLFLSIQANTETEIPSRGIVLDDIDRIDEPGGNESNSTTDRLRTTVQTAAVLSDTADWLSNRGGSGGMKDFHVLATMRSQVPTNIERIMSNWLTKLVKISEDQKADSVMTESGIVQRRWWVRSGEDVSVAFSLVCNNNGEHHCEWHDGTA